MRILLVTQMWPSAENPDLGSFLVPIKRELEASWPRGRGRGDQPSRGRADEVRAALRRCCFRREALGARHRLRPLPLSFRSGGSACVARLAGPARRHGPRPGRVQPRGDPRCVERHSRRGPACRHRDLQLALARRSSHRARPGRRGRRSRSSTAGSISTRSRPGESAAARAELELGRRWPRLPLRRLADRAQERAALGRGVRATWARAPRLRR